MNDRRYQDKADEILYKARDFDDMYYNNKQYPDHSYWNDTGDYFDFTFDTVYDAWKYVEKCYGKEVDLNSLYADGAYFYDEDTMVAELDSENERQLIFYQITPKVSAKDINNADLSDDEICDLLKETFYLPELPVLDDYYCNASHYHYKIPGHSVRIARDLKLDGEIKLSSNKFGGAYIAFKILC